MSLLSRTTRQAFNPTKIGGCKLWLSADSLVLDGVADGGAVTTWRDLSGNGDDATQATADNKPTLQTNELNGLPVVRFAGTNDTLNSTASAATKPVSIFLVGKAAAGGTQPMIGPSTNGGWAMLRASGSNILRFDKFGTGAIASSSTALTQDVAYVMGLTYSSAGVYSMTINGVVRASGTGNQTFTASTIRIGSAVGSFFFTGDIGDVLVYDSDLSRTAAARVERYLGRKYGIAVVA